MDQNLPVIAKRAWNMVRVIFFMLRKGFSKRKLLVDLNMMLKRGNKIASKAIGNLMFHHHHHHNDHRNGSFKPSTMRVRVQLEPPTQDDHDLVTMNAVKLALELLNNNEFPVPVEASPMLPGFGMSPMVRQLRITDSPFPLRGVDDDNGYVDKKADEFIENFYKELRKQKRMSG
ncbi:AVR9/CF-9 RAPIDLY ELICITED PROTEIN-RELATED [Salix koriyanagi]|uniref:AVR9/CF-9 RAPIDLY ELICITED PROTEIN-RELATED n=1 Tax=Salix koriyanagi TaxID=2511006 RepID=A0A9Q0Q6G9_9ROSI|nr:AVR9/CF-9 RAPIDLY ELICITED PROTEIN-RELATED [Salix koriyanagi]